MRIWLFWTIICQSLTNVIACWSCDPTISLLGICSKKMETRSHENLFMNPSRNNLRNCPKVKEPQYFWMDELTNYGHYTIEHYLLCSQKEWTIDNTWRHKCFKGIVLSGRNQSQKVPYSPNRYWWHRGKTTEMENRWMVSWGWRWGRIWL